jgi:hypothetical protein
MADESQKPHQLLIKVFFKNEANMIFFTYYRLHVMCSSDSGCSNFMMFHYIYISMLKCDRELNTEAKSTITFA